MDKENTFRVPACGSHNTIFGLFSQPSHTSHGSFSRLGRRRCESRHRHNPSTGSSPLTFFTQTPPYEDMLTPAQEFESSTPSVKAMEDDDEVCHDMGELSFCDTKPPSPECSPQYPPRTTTPRMTCLPPPARIIPTRSESVMQDGPLFNLRDDLDGIESPCKFPRPNSSLGFSSRLWSRSVSCLPVPSSLNPPPAIKPLRTVVEDGLAVPVLQCTSNHDRISLETALDFLKGRIHLPAGVEMVIWDGRFFFEYDAGHIRGARRFQIPGIRSQIEELVRNARKEDKRYCVLCYCQYSSARAPKLLDILRAVEKDIQLLERKGTELATEEKSRFRAFIVDGGYDAFYSNYPEMCEPRGYVKEHDDEVNGPRCRSVYEDDVKNACVSRVLMPSPATLIRRSKSSLEMRHRKVLSFSENHDANADHFSVYRGISDDEEEEEDRPHGPEVGRVRSLTFEDDF